MKKEVILVNPVFKEKLNYLNIPMGLLSVGSYLFHHGHSVRILDANNFSLPGDFHASLLSALSHALCVGISVMSSQIPGALGISHTIRDYSKNLPIIWGGVHPSLYPIQTVQSSYVDFVVIGEGEQTTLELINAIRNKGDLLCIHGIAYIDKTTGKPLITNSREYLDMNTLPRVEWSLLSDVKRIGNMGDVEKATIAGIPLQTSRGCPYRCTFCINSVLKEKYRYRDVDLVLDDLEDLVTRGGVKRIYFRDELFFSHKKRVLKMVEGIENRNLSFTWYGSVRSDYFTKHNLDLPLLKRLKKNGCSVVGIGAESGSSRILMMLDKRIKTDDILKAASLLDKAKIRSNFSFMIGLPGEEVEDMRKTIGLILKISRINSNFKILGPQVYRPYPGSALYVRCLESGMKEPGGLEEWEFSVYIEPEIKEKHSSSYPWITYPIKYLRNIIFYASMLGVHSRFPFVAGIMKKIARARCKAFFFKFPIEKKIYEFIKKTNIIALFKRS